MTLTDQTPEPDMHTDQREHLKRCHALLEMAGVDTLSGPLRDSVENAIAHPDEAFYVSLVRSLYDSRQREINLREGGVA
jgi:hypothetical protein